MGAGDDSVRGTRFLGCEAFACWGEGAKSSAEETRGASGLVAEEKVVALGRRRGDNVIAEVMIRRSLVPWSGPPYRGLDFRT